MPIAIDPVTVNAGSEGARSADRCRQLNDAFRRSFSGGKVMITPGVASLPVAEQAELFKAVRMFDGFTSKNDPYAEHDCAAVTVNGTRYLWKIDYYDPSLTFGSDDPADPAVTTRVLTIMMTEEY